MEQLYLVEIFVEKLDIKLVPEKNLNTEMGLYIRAQFGPKIQFIFKENQMTYLERHDKIEVKEKEDELVGGGKPPPLDNHGGGGTETEPGTKAPQQGKPTEPEKPDPTWSRTFRIGKSILFFAFPESVLLLLEQYPIEFSVWTDEEQSELIGTGTMHWHTQYFSHIMENRDPCNLYKAISSKELIPIMNECCCTKAGELQFVLRFTPLGYNIITEFQQLLDKNPDIFVFRTDKCPSLFECRRIELDNKAYNTIGSLYEIACREDPEVQKRMKKKIEVCTELESCGISNPGATFACQHPAGEPKEFKSITPKQYPINKVRMGDIVGPCGNTNCILAHKMRIFIRTQFAYKKETIGKTFEKKPKSSKRVCGTCGCSHDIYSQKLNPLKKNPVCKGCGKIAQSGETCDDRLKKLHGTGMSPINSKTELFRKQIK